MGKSSKKSATKVEAVSAVIKPTKPVKNVKRDAEDDLETKVDLKKQKKDVIAAVKLPKKVESSDSSDSSDSEEEQKAKKVPANKTPAKAASSSDEPAPATNGKKSKDDSSSEDESSDEEPAKKPAAVKAAKPAAKDSSSSEDESEDDSEDQEVKTDTKTAKKESSSDDSSEESDEEESDEEESPKKKKQSSDVEMVDGEQKSNAKQPKTPSTPSTGGGNTLFVANLPFQIERSDVENFFKEAGQVVDVRLGISKDDGSFRGFGHVEFATAEDAQKALELNDRPLLGRNIRLEVAAERGERPAYTPKSSNGGGGQTIFVKGFDSSHGEDDIKKALKEHFSSCGEITRVSVPTDRDTGASKGIAYIDFKEGAEKALELSGSDMGGWNIVVDEAKQRGESGGGGRRGGRFGSGGRRGGRGRDGGGRGRFGSGGRGRGRDGGRGRPSFTPSGKKTTFSDNE